MQESQTQFFDLYRTSLRAMNDLMKSSLETTERLQNQQLQQVRSAIEETTRSTGQMGEVRSMDELMAAQARLAGSQIQRTMDFWGSLWRAAGDNQINFFKGLGNGGETWSGVMTQYCEGVPAGTTTCPSSSAHVGYPTGGALAGVWVDTSSAAPSQATGNQIGAEAVKAAGHFGNTTASSNRNVQYVVLSPTGTHPDGFNTVASDFCAWHDYTGDATLSGGAPSSPYGPLAFTNEPYVTDAGSSCGSNFVNSGSAGTDDGVTIVEGHEYAETITDQFPAGGWTDLTGYENGDKCAWISSGQGAAQNITLTTGSYPVQSTWANDFNNGSGGCEIGHPVVT